MVLRLTILIFLTSLFLNSSAQGVDGIHVEEFYSCTAADAKAYPDLLNEGMKTYRVFVDLAEGYRLLGVYGDQVHELYIKTDTKFFNETDKGDRMGDRLDRQHMDYLPAVLDSWFTIGAVGDSHMGIPLESDSDKSIDSMKKLRPFKKKDGMAPMAVSGLVSSYQINLAMTHLGGGSEFRTNNGTWFLFGGAVGLDEENRVLIGQFTTDGSFEFSINLQVADANGTSEYYVATEDTDYQTETVEGLQFSTTADSAEVE